MPGYKNSFRSPTFSEQIILNPKGRVLGKIRIKPSSVAWKPCGQSKYFSVKLEDFTKWITNPATPSRKISA